METAAFLPDSLFLHIRSHCSLRVKLTGVVLTFFVIAVYPWGAWGPGHAALETHRHRLQAWGQFPLPLFVFVVTINT